MKTNSSPHLIDTNKIKLCKAKQEDMIDVFILANDPEVRKNSFNQKNITLEDHKLWFYNKISDQKSLILVAKIDNNFIGTIRFEKELNQHSSYVISIQIAKNFRGKKISEPLLKMAIKEFYNIFKNYDIIAKIKNDNLASKKIFIKNNFIIFNQNLKENYISLKYNNFHNT